FSLHHQIDDVVFGGERLHRLAQRRLDHELAEARAKGIPGADSRCRARRALGAIQTHCIAQHGGESAYSRQRKAHAPTIAPCPKMPVSSLNKNPRTLGSPPFACRPRSAAWRNPCREADRYRRWLSSCSRAPSSAPDETRSRCPR